MDTIVTGKADSYPLPNKKSQVLELHKIDSIHKV